MEILFQRADIQPSILVATRPLKGSPYDHRPVGVSFTIGNGAPTSITTAFGNIIVTRIGDSGTSKGTPYVYAPDVAFVDLLSPLSITS